MYVATHDAVSRVVSAAFTKRAMGRPRLWYLEPEGEVRGLSGGDLERAVDRIGLRFPGRVTERVH